MKRSAKEPELAHETVHLIAAARPNFMKVAPLWHALAAARDFAPVLVHTGQHYDANMSGAFLADLGLPEPDFHLGVGSGSHAEQTGRVMIEYEKVARGTGPTGWSSSATSIRRSPRAGRGQARHPDRPSRGGPALARPDHARRDQPHRHRRDLRRAVDAVARRRRNLLAEGVPAARITRVGNIMLDSFERKPRRRSRRPPCPTSSASTARPMASSTLHRPSNVDDPGAAARASSTA